MEGAGSVPSVLLWPSWPWHPWLPAGGSLAPSSGNAAQGAGQTGALYCHVMILWDSQCSWSPAELHLRCCVWAGLGTEARKNMDIPARPMELACALLWDGLTQLTVHLAEAAFRANTMRPGLYPWDITIIVTIIIILALPVQCSHHKEGSWAKASKSFIALICCQAMCQEGRTQDGSCWWIILVRQRQSFFSYSHLSGKGPGSKNAVITVWGSSSAFALSHKGPCSQCRNDPPQKTKPRCR